MIIIKAFVIYLFCIFSSKQTVVVLNGGQVTINGAITNQYIDLYLNFTANVQWVAMIWSQNEADTDVTLLQVNSNNPAIPVTLLDCTLDQNSYIKTDNIQNLMTSITGFPGDISSGIKAAFKRDLSTGDKQDMVIYTDSVIQVCFICSAQPFKGGGYQTGNQKVCSYLSLHKNVQYLSDRLLGNFAATSTFGGGNLTVYATQSTDGVNFQSWLFLSVVHKAQGLNVFSPKWIGVTYEDKLALTDMALIQYTTIGVKLDIHVVDYYIVNSTSAGKDASYMTSQGGQDLVKVLSAYNPSSYFVGSFKRKFSTGDVNRDIVVDSGQNKFCFIYGDNLAYSSFTQVQRACFDFTLGPNYNSNFRQSSSTSVVVTPYVAPKNSVTVKTIDGNIMLFQLILVILMIIL